jgi:hypothetical protein
MIPKELRQKIKWNDLPGSTRCDRDRDEKSPGNLVRAFFRSLARFISVNPA